jgi:hypothetical protein
VHLTSLLWWSFMGWPTSTRTSPKKGTPWTWTSLFLCFFVLWPPCWTPSSIAWETRKSRVPWGCCQEGVHSLDKLVFKLNNITIWNHLMGICNTESFSLYLDSEFLHTSS